MSKKEIEDTVEVMKLESLITGGTKNIIPVNVKYLGQTFGAYIRPINAFEHNQITQKFLNNKESIIINTVKKCLFKDDEISKYNNSELEAIPNGVVEVIYRKILQVSGMEEDLNDPEQIEIARQLMGF